MKANSIANDAHMEFFIATLQSQILSHTTQLAKARVEAAKIKDNGIKKLAPSALLKGHIPVLPNEVVARIVASIYDYGKVVQHSRSFTEHPSFFLVDLDPSVILDGWTAHRVIRSLPMTAHIDDEVEAKLLLKLLACKSINISLTLIETSCWERVLPILLQCPDKLKSLKLQLEQDQIVPVLQECAAALPHLEYMQIIIVDNLSEETRSSIVPSLREINERDTQLKTASLSWPLMGPLLSLGLLGSVTSLRLSVIFDGPEDRMLRCFYLLPDLPQLEELDICTYYRKLTETSIGAMHPIRCARLHSLELRDVHVTFLDPLLKTFSGCNIQNLYLETDYGRARWMMTRNIVQSLHDAFPNLQELSFTSVSRYTGSPLLRDLT